MKNIMLLLLSMTLFLTGCRSQEKDSTGFIGADGRGFTSFEEKQKSSQPDRKQDVADKNPFGALNFRVASRKATPGVVHVKSSFTSDTFNQIPEYFRDFFGDFWRENLPPDVKGPSIVMGSASGVIVSSDGYIVTNHHVIIDADSVEVVLHDQRNYKAKVVGKDPATDLALLKIDESNLSFIEFGNSDSVEVGDVVLAVGNPFNLSSTVTAGIVSAKARNINIISDKSAVESFIQTDAAVNRGNSGGALVDVFGKLVGINAAIATPTGTYAGYSFAIPVEIVKKTIDDLLRYGKVMRGYLGMMVSDMNGVKAKRLGISITTGAMVDSLEKTGAAFQAGIKHFDVITKIDDHFVENATQLREIVARHTPGEKLRLTVVRGEVTKVIAVTLQPAKDMPPTVLPGEEILKILGIDIENISEKEKRQLNIPGGVRVKRIRMGKIARETDIKEGFIITRINGNAVNGPKDFLRELKDKKGGVMLEGIYPGLRGVHFYAFGL